MSRNPQLAVRVETTAAPPAAQCAAPLDEPRPIRNDMRFLQHQDWSTSVAGKLTPKASRREEFRQLLGT